jgi:hypothetical protein
MLQHNGEIHKCERLKNIQIGQSAAKHRKGEGSSTIESAPAKVEVSRVGLGRSAREFKL